MPGIISRLYALDVLCFPLIITRCSRGWDAGIAAPIYSGNTAPAAITLANRVNGAPIDRGVNEAVILVMIGEGTPLCCRSGLHNRCRAVNANDMS